MMLDLRAVMERVELWEDRGGDDEFCLRELRRLQRGEFERMSRRFPDEEEGNSD